MAKKNLLLVDADPKSVRVMEVSLRQAGFSVTTSPDGEDALEKVALNAPDLIIADTKLPGMDGFAFATRVKADPRLATIPFLFLSSQNDIEHKVKGLELGVEDYLTKPIYIKEILTRVRILMEKREKEGLERRDRTGFAGVIGEMGVVDLIQTIELGRKTGILNMQNKTQKGQIYFRNGKVIDAALGHLNGEKAFYRFLLWNEGSFSLEFGDVGRPDRIDVTSQGLLMEGMRRVDEWNRLLEQIPALGTLFEIDYRDLADRLAEIPDEVNGILRLFDGQRTLMQVVDESTFGDLEALNIISKLYFEGLIFDTSTRDSRPERAQTRILSWLDEPDTNPPLTPAPEENASQPPAAQSGPAESISRVPISTEPPPVEPPPPAPSTPPATVPAPSTPPTPVEATAPSDAPHPGEEPVALEEPAAPPEAKPAPPPAISASDAASAVDALQQPDDGMSPLPPLPPMDASAAAPVKAPPPAVRASSSVSIPMAGGRGRGTVPPTGSSPRLAPIQDRAPSQARMPVAPPAPDPAAPPPPPPPQAVEPPPPPPVEPPAPPPPAPEPPAPAPVTPPPDNALVGEPPRRVTDPMFSKPMATPPLADMHDEVTPVRGIKAAPVAPPPSSPPAQAPQGAAGQPGSAPLAWALPAMTQAPGVQGGDVPMRNSGVMTTGEFETALKGGNTWRWALLLAGALALGGLGYASTRGGPETPPPPPKQEVVPPVEPTPPPPPPTVEPLPPPVEPTPPPPPDPTPPVEPTPPEPTPPPPVEPPAPPVKKDPTPREHKEPVKKPDPPPPAEKDPADDAKAFEKAVRRGKAMVEQGNAKGAVAELKKALAIKPGSAVALAELGNAYYELGDNAAALQTLQNAVGADASYAHAYVLLGAVYQGMNRASDARNAYEKYLALEPNGKFAQDVKSILKALKK
jgi:DNA-binding response OmpR family regulator